MILGVSQVDITPNPGAELSGFAARLQPSMGVLDPLFAKALFLASGRERLLWIHCDLIGFDRSIVTRFRDWAREAFGLQADQVMLSATHTHAGPCTIHLREAGEYDPAYVECLQEHLHRAAKQAMTDTAEVELALAEARLDLAVDRRKTASAHTDPRVAAIGFRRADGAFAAAVVHYAMHPVALGPRNRCISADISGQASNGLASRLPGNPVVVATNGACANLNPPAENVPFAQVEQWGHQIANAIASPLEQAPGCGPVPLRVLSRRVPLPVDVLDADGINRFADRALRLPGPLAEWGDKYRRVVEHWRSELLHGGGTHASGQLDAELFATRLGHVILVGVNAEVFSEFTRLLRGPPGQRIYVIGYANGDLGYLPPRAAYAEGGYEVDVAHLFYGGFRPTADSLELLAAAANALIAEWTDEDPSGLYGAPR